MTDTAHTQVVVDSTALPCVGCTCPPVAEATGARFPWRAFDPDACTDHACPCHGYPRGVK